MRLWISPSNEIVDLDKEDEPHSMFVAKNAETFGLRDEPVGAHLRATFDNPEGDVEFDYDTLIVMAEMNGWVRVAADGREGRTAVSASHPRHARRGIGLLLDHAPGLMGVDLEIERIEGECVVRTLRHLSPPETIHFVDRGVLPMAPSYSTPVGDRALLEALSSGNAPAAAL